MTTKIVMTLAWIGFFIGVAVAIAGSIWSWPIIAFSVCAMFAFGRN